MVLVDTNIWIDAFKDPGSTAIPELTELVLQKNACITPIIRAELLSGARDDAEYRLLDDRLLSIPLLDERRGVWDQVARARFQLARRGIQEGLLDLSIACAAHHHRAALWTRDKRFEAIQTVIAFKRFQPHRP